MGISEKQEKANQIKSAVKQLSALIDEAKKLGLSVRIGYSIDIDARMVGPVSGAKQDTYCAIITETIPY